MTTKIDFRKLLFTPWLRRTYFNYWLNKQKKKVIALIPPELINQLGKKECAKLAYQAFRMNGVDSIKVGNQAITIIRSPLTKVHIDTLDRVNFFIKTKKG